MKTFAGIAKKYGQYETASILLQSIPYDCTSTWGKGADKGFSAFLDAADNMELYDIETESEVYLHGIHLLEELKDFSSPEQMYNHVYAHTKELLLTGKFLTFFGGEHSISIGILQAFYENYTDLTVLQIDAHADLRPEYLGSKYNHACALYDASKNCNLIQVGIRSLDSSELQHLDKYKCYWAHEIQVQSNWIDDSISQMTNDVYITLDLDALDPSIMPGTGTPEPGGLGWYELINYLKRVFEEKNVVGFDIVELAPIKGNRASEFLAAKLYYKMLSYKFELNEK
ncbi:agmatinase [Saprospiraceae bacterium]|nr:agmatinase [Saprospiraceae bacterium]